MAQQMRAASLVHTERHSFEDNDVKNMESKDCWFERGVKEAIVCHSTLSSAYKCILTSLPRLSYNLAKVSTNEPFAPRQVNDQL